MKLAIAALATAAACAKAAPPADPAPDPRAAPPSDAGLADAASADAAPRAWRGLRIETTEQASGKVVQAVEIRAGGAAQLTMLPHIAPSTATASPALLAAIDAWVANPPSLAPGTLDGAAYVARFTLDADRPLQAVFDAAHVPEPWLAIYQGASALINTPRTAVRCLAWDGTGDFAIDVWTQDYGVAPGPLTHTIVDGKAGTLAFAPDAQTAVKTTALTAAELAAIRAAMRAADLGAFTEVSGGAGEGSNLRTLQLTTAAGPCARTFTNQFPAGLDPVFQAIVPARARLPK